MPDNHHRDQRLMYMLIFLYFFVCGVIIGGSVLLYFSEKESLRNDDTNELLAIAELKAKQISEFRRERFSEANFIHRNTSFITAAKNYRDNPRLSGNKSKVDDWLSTILTNHNYESITILDTLGKVFYTAGQRDTLNDEHIEKALQCSRENKICFGDLYLHSDSVTIHLEIFVPLELTTSHREKIGLVNFTINPHNGLFDLMQSWPIQSRTAEVIVVRKDGDEVLFLNDLRHKKNAAMKFRLPLSQKNLPAARGLRGGEGIIEGLDYRDQEVLSAVKKIPNSDWLVIAKMDTEEVFEPLTKRAVLIFGLMMTLLIASGTAFFIVWRGQRMKQLRIEVQSVEAVKRLNRVYQVLSNANQAIVKIEDRDTLLNDICRIAVDHGDFRLCWIGLHNSHTGLIEPVSKAGVASEYLDHITVSIDENTPAGQGPSGTSFRTGKPVVLNDIWTSFQMSPWKENVLRFNLKSIAAFPLTVSGATIGTINFYSGRIDFFTSEEMKLLDELSQDLSYALSNIEREKEKKETEARYRALHEQSPNGILLIDIDTGKTIECNERAYQQLGYTREEFAELRISDYEVLEKPEDTAERMKRIKIKGSDDFETQHRTKSGVIRDVHVFAKTIQFDNRTLIYSIFQDITERKQAEKALRESDALLWEVMDSLPVGVAVNSVNPSVKFSYMNENFIKNYRTTREALADENVFWEAVYEDPAFRKEIKEQVLADCASGDPKRMFWEDIPITRKGETYFITAQNLPIPEKDLTISMVWDVTQRVHSNRLLHESEEMFRKLFELSTDPILILNENGFTDCNSAAVSILGYSIKEDVVNKKPAELSPEKQPDGRFSSEKAVEMIDLAERHGYHMFEWVHKKSDGSDFFVEVMLTSITLRGRQSFYTVWRDITERKKAEASLKESIERFNLVARATNDAVWDWDITKNETWWNERFYSLFGFTAGADKPGIELWSSRIHPDDRGRVMEHFRDAISGISQGWSDEFRYQFANGSYGFIFGRAYILRDDSGNAARMTGSMIDITELKAAENKLRESEARYRLISENSTDVIWLFDLAQQKLTYISPSVQKLRGFTPEEVLRQPLEELLTPDSQKKFYEELAAFNSGDRSHLMKTIEIDQPHKMGHVVKTEIVVTLLPEETGNSALLLGVSRDITERKVAEEKLHLQSAALRATANGIVITDPDGLIEWVNPAFSELSGYSFEEAVGKNPRDLVRSGEHDDTFYKNMWTTITSGQVWRGELINRRKDGNFYIEEQTITPIRNAVGKITHFIGVKLDITERKKAEDQLRENEERLRLSLKAASQGLFDLNIQTGAAIVSEEYATMLGYDPKTFVETNASWIERLHPDDKELAAKEYSDYISGKKDEYRVEFRQKTRSGAWKWILSMGKIVSWTPEGKPLRMLGTHTDLDDRKKIEQALRESEETYKAFFEDDLTGDFISTPDGRLLACNLPFAKIFGYDSVDEIMQVNAHSFYPDQKARDLLVKRLTREKRIEYYSSELIRKDGTKVYVIENLIGKFDKKRKLIEIKGYLFDDTNRRILERQLIQAQKMESLGTLAGGIAHDFNNILAIVLGHNSLIRRKFADNAYIAENAETIAKATQRGAGLVKQLLTFARKSDVVLESILIQDTINEIKKFIEQTFPKTITIQTECETNLPPIVADATQIHQVLLNLCINARDAMPHGGTLAISAIRINALEIQSKVPKAYSPEYIHITVSDTGTGMDEATRIRIFEPFFTTKGRDRGTGLGLATVYGIIEAHHGIIEVESEIGKGSAFHIYFPVQQSFIDHHMTESGPEEIPGGNETILVVDDEESMTAFLSAVFKEKGYTVITASDGEEALEIYKRKHSDIDIVLTDMGLPKLGGEDVVRGIKKVNKDARIIVASGYFERELKSELIKSGVKNFVQKPYLPDEILQKVREMLDLK